jgi:hypothetical protein
MTGGIFRPTRRAVDALIENFFHGSEGHGAERNDFADHGVLPICGDVEPAELLALRTGQDYVNLS